METKKQQSVIISIVIILVVFLTVLLVRKNYNKEIPQAPGRPVSPEIQGPDSLPVDSINKNKSQTTNSKNMENTIRKDNGLIITITKQGDGKEAVNGKNVTVNYTGKFEDGKIFDSSLNAGRTPFTFTLGAGQVIKGWEEGVLGMKVGEKRTLTIPYQLGYGENGYGPIPAKATLIFDVELLDVE